MIIKDLLLNWISGSSGAYLEL